VEKVRNSGAVHVKFNTLSQYLSHKLCQNKNTPLILLPLTPPNTTAATTTDTVYHISAIADIKREFHSTGIKSCEYMCVSRTH